MVYTVELVLTTALSFVAVLVCYFYRNLVVIVDCDKRWRHTYRYGGYVYSHQTEALSLLDRLKQLVLEFFLRLVLG